MQPLSYWPHGSINREMYRGFRVQLVYNLHKNTFEHPVIDCHEIYLQYDTLSLSLHLINTSSHNEVLY